MNEMNRCEALVPMNDNNPTQVSNNVPDYVRVMGNEMLVNGTAVVNSASLVTVGVGDKPAHPDLMQSSKTKDGGAEAYIWSVKDKDTANVEAVTKEAIAYIDRASSKGVIHKNQAARRVSRLAKKAHKVLTESTGS